MPSLYIDRRCTCLKLDGEVLIGYENGKRIATIPLNAVDRLYMKGDISVQASLLAKLGEKNIGVVFLQGRKNTPTIFLAQPHNDAQRRVKQYQLSQHHEFCLPWAKNTICHKLVLQKQNLSQLSQAAQNLPFFARIDNMIMQIKHQPTISALRGVEGYAAQCYFESLQHLLPSELGFDGRNRRPPRDPVNVCLSLGYTILHSEAVNALYGAGLDPFVGFYHALDYGRESLACDVLETLRPLYDQWLISQFQQQIFSTNLFSCTREGCMLRKEGRIMFYQAFEKVAENWRKILHQQSYELAHLVKEYALNTPQQKQNIPLTIEEYHLNRLQIMQ